MFVTPYKYVTDMSNVTYLFTNAQYFYAQTFHIFGVKLQFVFAV